MLPEFINIGFKPVSSILLVFLTGITCWCFVLWFEAKKDGFNSEKFFDLIFLSIISSGLVYYGLRSLMKWLEIYHPSNLLLVPNKEAFVSVAVFLMSLAPILILSKKWKWSVFRIVDMYAMATSLLLMFLSLGKFLVYSQKEYLYLFLLLLFLYLFVMRYRGYKFLSGMVFSVFLLFIVLFLLLFFRKSGYLLFSVLLVTISMFNLYLRGKKTMNKSIIPEQFTEGLKKKLMSREKSLENEQQALIKEDPYLQHGRDVDNAEVMDEVLEDTGKTVSDARLGIVKSMKIQIRKALAAIKLGRYGKCEVCGKPIDKARLEAYPEATTCIECATNVSQEEDVKEDEILEKQLGE
ncbi:MAG: TraR/DksA C4-type zinc finger protein [Patescibacteria group bacterium]